MYYIEVEHKGLNKRKRISGEYQDLVEIKAQRQQAIWEEEWRRKLEVKKEREAKVAKNDLAAEQTREAQEAIEAIESTLQLGLAASHVISWEHIKDNSPFPEPKPTKPKPGRAPQEPTIAAEPSRDERTYDAQPRARPEPRREDSLCAHPTTVREPRRQDPKYLRVQRLGVVDWLSKARRQRKIAEAQETYERDHAAWEKKIADARAKAQRDYEQDHAAWEKQVADARAKLEHQIAEHHRLIQAQEADYAAKLAGWEEERAEFLRRQAEANAAIDHQKDEYFIGAPAAVEAYCELVLASSEYADTFPQEFEVEYIPSSHILIVDYSLPRIEGLPRLKQVKYVQSRHEFSESFLSERHLNKLYDDLLYQISLRTVHELYDSDTIGALESIVFNGWVTTTDRATGQQVTGCIMSLQTTREEFLGMNLAEVEPKTCFKNLKGVGSSKLHSLAPVPPVLTISREDSRFVSSYDVTDELDDSYNLAAMDWEDFEHLIRELFESEFSPEGGEVKITQASHDRGVDAVAFDPDPIRGGKIVIQAKRYTNVVGVSAVRDLYGTVINEGAMKGILVTTADYGPDAYEFAKGKPLTLLNGSNLLHLLAKHGHKAKIDLNEAKLIQAEKEKQSEAN